MIDCKNLEPINMEMEIVFYEPMAAPRNLDIGSEYLNLHHVVRVRLAGNSRVKVFFTNGRNEYYKGSKAEIIARWYKWNSFSMSTDMEAVSSEPKDKDRS